MYQMLILDDYPWGVDGSHKGYTEIDRWFPGIFEITICERVNRLPSSENSPYGLKLLEEELWDVVLLDEDFEPYPNPSGGMFYDGRGGQDVLHKIRNDKKIRVWVIGCSTSWRRSIFNSPRYFQGISENPEELRQCLSEFLAHQSPT